MQNQTPRNDNQFNSGAIKSKTENFVSDIEKKAATVGVEAQDKAGDLYQTAKESLAATGEKFSRGYDIAREGLSKGSTELESLVKRNPMMAVAAAAGIGWVVGRLLAPRIHSNR